MNHKQVLLRLLGYVFNQPRKLAIACALLFTAALAEVSGPWLIKLFLDDYVAENFFPVQSLVALAGGYILLQVLSAWLHYKQSIQFNHLAIEAVQTVRKQVYHSVMNQPLAAFDYTPIGKLVSRITNDTESLKDLYVQVLATALRNVVLIVVMLIVMSLLSWRLTLVVIVLLPSICGIMYFYQRVSAPAYSKVRDLLADLNASMSESIQGMGLIQLMRQERRFSEEYGEINSEHLRAEIGITRLNSFLLRPLIDLLSGLALLALVATFGVSGVELVGVGVLYAFISYLGRVTEPLIEMTQQLSLLQQAIVAGERLFELIDAEQQQYGGDTKPLQSGDIELNQVNFSYDGQQKVLNNINLVLPHCGFLALVGHTGSGKSTLASLLMGFYPPTEGDLKLDNRKIDTLAHSTVRQGIAMVQQDPHVLSESVRDNIVLGRDVNDEAVYHALQQVGLADYIEQLPEGLHTQLGQGEVNLSAGQKQLLALARVLVEKPKILILDEATANIDSGTEQLIQTTLDSLRKDMSLVVIAHRLSTIMDADEIMVLHHGHIEERGTHQELLHQQGRYWQMHKLQQVGEHLQELESTPS
ncbi:SmdB family multidrug efflux ABC transporter permease/ATP-binding protein [Vibrio sp. Of7-15]|uniref:SmdB family multidrug efflux ABC transporter permease/ATP-binding protein n=1 Tax=Vibrio sp. Of7-15 TaxID=2724879 RepID=UPI001EF1E666|nr:SmdB family multidrug efflux ABC transporter permease/ATP-binding protein [Vibrio sp. Of7-15]MCG7499873.1 SmdB family multidrug efflux ABC transporter permease/ATP-binding protein [Vibrio sp. Of7-15]